MLYQVYQIYLRCILGALALAKVKLATLIIFFVLNFQAPAGWDAGEYVGLIYSARMRTAPDKARVMALHQEMFPSNRPPYTPQGDLHVTSKVLQVGHSFLPRRRMLAELMSVSAPDLFMLHHSLRPLEDLMKCISMNWMAILVGHVKYRSHGP